MLVLLGNLLVWGAVTALPAMIGAPFAYLLFKDQPVKFAAAWAGSILLVVACGVAFSHFAVDLPTFRANPGYIVWVISLTLIILILSNIQTPAALLDRATHVADRCVRVVARGALALVFVMALVQFCVVILRYVFGLNFIWMQESITYMHGAVFLLAGGYALLTNDHVRVDIFYRDAPAKRKALVDFLGTYVFLFPFCLLLLWTGAPYIAQAWSVQEGSTEQSGIQAVFLLKTLIALFALLLTMAGFVVTKRAADILRGASAP